jgi:hypothetical protein
MGALLRSVIQMSYVVMSKAPAGYAEIRIMTLGLLHGDEALTDQAGPVVSSSRPS